MGYYCKKEDFKCPHHYDNICYIEECSYEEIKAFECDCKPDVKEDHRASQRYGGGTSYYGSNTKSYIGDGYCRNNYVY